MRSDASLEVKMRLKYQNDQNVPLILNPINNRKKFETISMTLIFTSEVEVEAKVKAEVRTS